MSFFRCELRCHILDRQDQLASAKSSRTWHKKKIDELTEAVHQAQNKLDEFNKHVAKRELFIELVESTLDQRWISNPDVVEAEWFKNHEVIHA